MIRQHVSCEVSCFSSSPRVENQISAMVADD